MLDIYNLWDLARQVKLAFGNTLKKSVHDTLDELADWETDCTNTGYTGAWNLIETCCNPCINNKI